MADWTTWPHAYGSATDTPGHLRALESGDEEAREAAAEAEVLPKALARARTLTGKNPQTLAAIKTQMYTGPLAALREG